MVVCSLLLKKLARLHGTFIFFQVYIKATQRSNKSEVNIDNIFFMEDFCDPVPEDAQRMLKEINFFLKYRVSQNVTPNCFVMLQCS